MKRELRAEEEIPVFGDQGGPMLCAIIEYEDGTELQVPAEAVCSLMGCRTDGSILSSESFVRS